VRVLLTGATGFVGSHVAEALIARGHTVVALARRPEAYAALERLGATPAPGALEDGGSLDGALEGVGAVFHIAGLTAAANEAEFLAVNEGGTRRLLEAVGRRSPGLTRFVFVSSQAALGPSPRGTPLDEDAPCRPVTAYGRSKLAGERVVRAADVPWTIVRPSPVYGPRDREFLRLFRIARRGIAPVFGTGAQELSMVYVTDLADAIVRALERPEAVHRVYHAAHRDVVLSREVAREAGRAIGTRTLLLPVPALLARPIVAAIGRAAAAAGRRTVVNSDKMAEFLAPSWLMNVERAERELHWCAVTNLAAGMALTAAWYRREGWLP
jgi:nucleoside-diphosphate-sugar epimerase